MNFDGLAYTAGFLHDVGKIASFKNHGKVGANLLQKLDVKLSAVTGYHHERVEKKGICELIHELENKINTFFEGIKYKTMHPVKDLATIAVALRLADKSATGMEMPGLFKVKFKKNFSAVILPIKFTINLPNIKFPFEKIMHSLTSIVKNHEIFEKLYSNSEDSLLKVMSIIPKETRYPYCDVSLLTHSLTVAALTVALANCLKEISEISIKAIFTDFSEFFLRTHRLPAHKAKLEQINAFYQQFLNKASEQKLLYNLILPSASLKSKYLYQETCEDILKLTQCSAFNPFIWIGSKAEEQKFDKLTRTLIDTLESLDLYDVSDFYLIKTKYIKVNTENEELRVVRNLNRNLFRYGLREIWKKRQFYETHYPLKIETSKFEDKTRICEFCGKRSYTILFRSHYRFCGRCYQMVKGIKGVFLDDVADDDDYVALLGWSLDSNEILFGRSPIGDNIPVMGYMSLFGNIEENFRIALFWSFDRAFERISDLFSSYSLMRREFVNKLRELEENHQISRKYHVKCNIGIPEEELKQLKKREYLVKVDTREKSYAASLNVDRSELELIGVSEDKVDQILEEKFIIRVSELSQPLIQKFEPKAIKEKQREAISSSERIIMPYFDLEKCFILMPAKLTIHIFDFLKNHLIFPIKKVGIRIKKKDYPLYEMLLSLKNEVVRGR